MKDKLRIKSSGIGATSQNLFATATWRKAFSTPDLNSLMSSDLNVAKLRNK
jgi:hypothetical protein